MKSHVNHFIDSRGSPNCGTGANNPFFDAIDDDGFGEIYGTGATMTT